MVDLVLKSQNIISADIPQITPDEGPARNLDEIAKSRATIAAQYQKKSENIFANKFETQTRENVNNIFNESPNDPDLVKKKIDEYADGVFKDIPFDQRSDFRKSYVSLTSPLITKAFNNKNSILTNELIVSTEQNRDQILIDIQRDSESLLVPDSRLSDDERLIQQTESLEALETNFQSLSVNLSRVGPNGKPLYSAKDQIRIISNAKEVMLSTASKTWLDQQPNKLKALREWSSGALTLPVFDGEKIVHVPVKHAFNPAIVDKVEKELISRARNELSISDKAEKHQERLRDRVADNVANEFFSRASRGDLDVDDVENAREILKPKDFKSSLTAARSKVVVQDGVTYNALFQKANNGDDVTDEATAALEQGLLNPEGFTRLISINRRDELGMKNPVEEGRSVLRGHLSGVYTPNEGVKHRLYSQGERAYNDAIRERKNEIGVALTVDETREIADRIGGSFSSRPEGEITFTRPKYGPIGLLGNPKTRTVETVQKILEETVRFFIDKWDGNKVAAAGDVAYRKQRKIIKQWEVIAIQNEKRMSLIEARRAQRNR